MVISEARRGSEVRTKRIDGDTHYNLTLDYKELRDLLPRSQMREAQDMMWRDGERFANPNGVRADVGGRVGGFGGGTPDASTAGDPTRDPDARVIQIDKLGFDMQILICSTAMPSPLRPADKPLWLRTALAQLYNNASAKLQDTHPDRFICHATVPWDDIDASVKELERASKLGLKAVLIAGSYMNQNLDAYELYPFWQAVSDLDMTCFVHDTPQPCGGTILHHSTPYPMVGWERYERLHIGTYLGFGIDYTVAVASLSLGGVLDEFPNLRFVFMEGGALWMSYAMAGADRSFFIEPACSRTRNRPSELILRHCLTEVQGLEPVEAVVAGMGADNLFLSTDFPHPEFQALPNSTSDITDKAGLSEADKAKILGGNLARFLKV
ncbi:MAG TPA: amidohydrolase family protein [Dehalococcoidia bacterium]|nr:amidohydrolase family protein [Dehalococcoidia bacterium]